MDSNKTKHKLMPLLSFRVATPPSVCTTHSELDTFWVVDLPYSYPTVSRHHRRTKNFGVARVLFPRRRERDFPPTVQAPTDFANCLI